MKASGLRWLSLMMLVDIPWAQRVWALPFLTVLAPSKRYDHERGHRHKCLTDWARQMLLQVQRWLPHRQLVVVADSSFAALELLFALSQVKPRVHVVTRLRLDAAIALVRQQLWQFRLFQLSDVETETVNVPRTFFNCWSDLLCYAA